MELDETNKKEIHNIMATAKNGNSISNDHDVLEPGGAHGSSNVAVRSHNSNRSYQLLSNVELLASLISLDKAGVLLNTKDMNLIESRHHSHDDDKANQLCRDYSERDADDEEEEGDEEEEEEEEEEECDEDVVDDDGDDHNDDEEEEEEEEDNEEEEEGEKGDDCKRGGEEDEEEDSSSEDFPKPRTHDVIEEEEFFPASDTLMPDNDLKCLDREESVPSSITLGTGVVNVSGNNKHAHGDQVTSSKVSQRRSPRKSRTVMLELGARTGVSEDEKVSKSPKRRSPSKSTMVLVTGLVRPKDLANGIGDGQGESSSRKLRKSSSNGSGRRPRFETTTLPIPNQNPHLQLLESRGSGGATSPRATHHRHPQQLRRSANRIYFYSDDEEGETAVDARQMFSPHRANNNNGGGASRGTIALPPSQERNNGLMLNDGTATRKSSDGLMKVRTYSSRKISRFSSQERGTTDTTTTKSFNRMELERAHKIQLELQRLNENLNNETKTRSNSTDETSKKDKKKKKKKGEKEPQEEESPTPTPEDDVNPPPTRQSTTTEKLASTSPSRKISVVEPEKEVKEEKKGKKKKDKHDAEVEEDNEATPIKRDKSRASGMDDQSYQSQEEDKAEKEAARQQRQIDSELGVIVYQIEVRFIIFKNLRFCGGVRVLMNCQEEKAYLQLITLMNEVFATYDIDNICFLEPRSAAGVSFCAVPYYSDKERADADNKEDDPNLTSKEKERRKRCKEKQRSRLPTIEHAEVVFCTPEQMVRFKTVIDTLLCAISCIDMTKPPSHLTDMVCDGATGQPMDEFTEEQREFLNTCFDDPNNEVDGLVPGDEDYDAVGGGGGGGGGGVVYDPMNDEAPSPYQPPSNRQSAYQQKKQGRGQQHVMFEQQSQYQTPPQYQCGGNNRQSQYQNNRQSPYQQNNRQSPYQNSSRQQPQQQQQQQQQQAYRTGESYRAPNLKQQQQQQQPQYGTRASQSQGTHIQFVNRPSVYEEMTQQHLQEQQQQQQQHKAPKNLHYDSPTAANGGDPLMDPSVVGTTSNQAPGPKKITTMQSFDPCPKDPLTNAMACLPCDLGDPYQLNNNEGRVVFCTPACLKISSRTGEKIVYRGKLKIVQGCGGIGFIVRIENLEGNTLYCHSLRRDLTLYATQEVPFGFGYSTVVCTSGRTTMESFVVAFPSAYQRDQFQHAVNTCKDILGMTSVQSLTHVKTF